jgi:hypothetical protein
MSVLWRICLVALVTLVLCMPAAARVRIEIQTADGAGAADLEFLVTIHAEYPLIHSSLARQLHESFVQSGAPHLLWTGYPNPFLFARFYTRIYHPEYAYILLQSDENPWWLRTVSLPAIRPRRWRELLDAREPLTHKGIGEILDVEARGEVPNLAPLLPLFEELVVYASEAEMNRSYSPSVEAERRARPEVAERLHREMLRRVASLEAQLVEIRRLLAATDPAASHEP